MYEVFELRKNIYQIREADDAHLALIVGERSAILMDTGYGLGEMRAFVEEKLGGKPYIVVASHGHPDHVQGIFQFDEVYLHPADKLVCNFANTPERRAQTFDRFARSERLDPKEKESYVNRKSPKIRPLEGEPEWDLGGLHVQAVELPGHTKGEIGLLIREERLLLAGDAFGPHLWMFADNHDTLEMLEATLKKALALPMDCYLHSHETEPRPRAFLEEVRNNVQKGEVSYLERQKILGRTVYPMRYAGEHGTSEIWIPEEDTLRIARERKRGLNTLLTHGDGGPASKDPHGSMLPPVYQTSAYAHGNAEEIADIFAKKRAGFNYSRLGNPTVAAFEQRMTALERGAVSVATASGMAAITYALLTLLQAGDEFLSADELYGGTFNLFDGLKRFGITPLYVDALDISKIEAAVTERTRLIFIETMSNPGLNVYDIRAVAEVAHAHGLPLIVDNTMATPCLTRPIEFGADIVIHSTSKYINGSGDAISGVVTDSGKFKWKDSRFAERLAKFLPLGPNAFAACLRAELLANHGACLAPQNAFLNMIGMETLALRVERECANAKLLAEYFQDKGLAVNYPGLESARTNAVARRLFRNGFGAILTVRLGSRERAFAFMDALKLPYIVSNIGDTRTLVVHPASTMALHNTPEERETAGVYDDLVRISVGIEDAGDLLEDFGAALGKLEQARI